MKSKIFRLILASLIFVPALGYAQTPRDKDFKDKYKLKEAVVLSRHNIRSPFPTARAPLEESLLTNGTNGQQQKANLPQEVECLKHRWDSISANGLSTTDCSLKTMFPQLMI